MTASKKAEEFEVNAQMQQQIEALREQISLEERALLEAKSRKPQQLAKSVWYENAFKDTIQSHFNLWFFSLTVVTTQEYGVTSTKKKLSFANQGPCSCSKAD